TISIYLYYISLNHYYSISFIFFFNDTATTDIYTLSLHDALPIFLKMERHANKNSIARAEQQYPLQDAHGLVVQQQMDAAFRNDLDRKSTRLNSSHVAISYAVFCLKKKKKQYKKDY